MRKNKALQDRLRLTIIIFAFLCALTGCQSESGLYEDVTSSVTVTDIRTDETTRRETEIINGVRHQIGEGIKRVSFEIENKSRSHFDVVIVELGFRDGNGKVVDTQRQFLYDLRSRQPRTLRFTNMLQHPDVEVLRVISVDLDHFLVHRESWQEYLTYSRF